MYSMNNSGIFNHRKNMFIKGKGLNFISFPKINIPYFQSQQNNSNNFQNIQRLKKCNTNLKKIKNNSANLISKYNQKVLRFQSRFGNHMFNLINKNRNNTSNII